MAAILASTLPSISLLPLLLLIDIDNLGSLGKAAEPPVLVLLGHQRYLWLVFGLIQSFDRPSGIHIAARIVPFQRHRGLLHHHVHRVFLLALVPRFGAARRLDYYLVHMVPAKVFESLGFLSHVQLLVVVHHFVVLHVASFSKHISF